MGRLMRLIEHGLPLPFGSIRNRRSFIFIDNLVDALATVVTHPADIRSIYFLNDGSDFSTPELVVSLAAAAGRPTRLWHVPVGILKLLGRMGDGIGHLPGVSAGIDSYSVERLVGSMAVNGALFCRSFNWQAPVGWAQALRVTGSAPGVSK
jgi:nucleoside-diphosphate-sugar epimerase